MHHRFGPGPALYLATLAAVGWVVAFFATGKEHPVFLLAGILIVLGTLRGWTWYRLDTAGIHRRGILGAKFVPWDDVETVVGRRAERADRPTTVLTQLVVDARGRPLLRLDPWTRHRREMVRLILATVSARRKEGAPRDD